MPTNMEVGPIQEQSRLRRLGSMALGGAIVGLAAASWGFQIGPWNEALRVDQATKVLEETFDPNQAALTVAGITAAVELTSASLIAFGLNTGNGLINWFKNRKKGKEMIDEAEEAASDKENKASKLGSLATDTALSMAGGAGVVTVRHHIKDKVNDKRLGKDLLIGAAATAPVTALSGFVGYTAAKSIVTAGESDWFGSEYVVKYGTSNKFWMSALAVGYGVFYAWKGINKLKNRNKGTEEIGEEDTTPTNLFSRPQLTTQSEEIV